MSPALDRVTAAPRCDRRHRVALDRRSRRRDLAAAPPAAEPSRVSASRAIPATPPRPVEGRDGGIRDVDVDSDDFRALPDIPSSARPRADRGGAHRGRGGEASPPDACIDVAALIATQALAAELRRRLVERRRAEAAAGARAGRSRGEAVARAGRRGRRDARAADARRSRRADPARGRRARPARGAARRPRGRGGDGERARARLRRAPRPDRARPRSASPPRRRSGTRSSGSSRRSAAGSTSSARWSTRGSRTARASTSSSRRSRSTARRCRSAASRPPGPGPEELVELGTLTEELHDQLGGRGARRGAASWSAAAPARARRRCSTRCRPSSIRDERVITIEDAAELRLRQPHVVRLESRPAERRGARRGDDPRPAAQRAADAPGPDRDRRGARRARRSTC